MTYQQRTPEHLPNPELPSVLLVQYLAGQFADARAKEGAEDKRGERAAHGSFIRYTGKTSEEALVRQTYHITFALPFPRTSEETKVDVHELKIGEAYLIQQFAEGQVLPYEFADSMGVMPADYIEREQGTLESFMYRAGVMLDLIKFYNIVAVAKS